MTSELTLNNPLTEEQWDMITDVDFDRTDHITFHTKHGKEVEFTKVIWCKDCDWFDRKESWCEFHGFEVPQEEKGFCYWAVPKERTGEQ